MKRKAATGPLRGEDAWLSAKADIAKRNDAARTRLADERAAQQARRAVRRRELEDLQSASMPQPPKMSLAPTFSARDTLR